MNMIAVHPYTTNFQFLIEHKNVNDKLNASANAGSFLYCVER